MSTHFEQRTLNVTGADQMYELEVIQRLWSDYGRIVRYALSGGNTQSVVVKHVRLPKEIQHPRGWNTNTSHQRKLKSYQVESNWYMNFASRCDASCRVPHCIMLEDIDDEVWIVLEDLDESGFQLRHSQVSLPEMSLCLKWLANFHATFMGEAPVGLWEIGTYWHLDTRPDELAALTDLPLKQVAKKIDFLLKQSPFQTLVHGDAKLANFCFSSDRKRVAGVDFQYVGGGCGMKDVAYFIGSCLDEADCERFEKALLDIYFKELDIALGSRQKAIDFRLLEKDWRSLYPLAWTDFHRFLKGWSPDHWKINSYSERLAKQVIAAL